MSLIPECVRRGALGSATTSGKASARAALDECQRSPRLFAGPRGASARRCRVLRHTPVTAIAHGRDTDGRSASGAGLPSAESYMPTVRKVAKRLKRELPACVELDDLFQDGMVAVIALLARAGRQAGGMLFEAYVAQRVLGAMLDGLRANDFAPRRVRRIMREARAAGHRLGHQLGRSPSELELATEIGLTITELQTVLRVAHETETQALDVFDCEEEGCEFLLEATWGQIDPSMALQRSETQRRVSEAFDRLPAVEQWVVEAYHLKGCTMREIGATIHVSEGRVSQLRSRAIARLRRAAE